MTRLLRNGTITFKRNIRIIYLDMCVYVCVLACVRACACVCVSMRRYVWMETILRRTIASLDSKHCNCPISGSVAVVRDSPER